MFKCVWSEDLVSKNMNAQEKQRVKDTELGMTPFSWSQDSSEGELLLVLSQLLQSEFKVRVGKSEGFTPLKIQRCAFHTS